MEMQKSCSSKTCAIISIFLIGGFVNQSSAISVIHFGRGSGENGFLLNFVVQTREFFVKKPYDYSREAVEEIALQYRTNQSIISGRTPDIIVIMDESFADLNVLGKTINTNIEVTPFINSLTENTTKGLLLSSVYGGWTPNSEYEFLTGNSLLFLNGIVFQQYLQHPSYSMVSELKKADYTCIAMHPYYASGWKRATVWPNLLFDECFFLDSFPQKRLIRGLVSDQEMFDVIIQTYEERKNSGDDRLFIFGVTMQNHGGYTDETYTPTVEMTGLSRKYKDVEQYLSLINETDKAVENLIKYFKTKDDEVVIVFLGDHQPALDNQFLLEMHENGFTDLQDIKHKYEVPFFVWTNYDTPEESVEMTSLNYLSTLVFEKAGLSLPAYNCFLADLKKKIPVINSQGYYSVEDHKFKALEEAEGKERELLDQYWTVEYNSLFDTNHANKILFPLYE